MKNFECIICGRDIIAKKKWGIKRKFCISCLEKRATQNLKIKRYNFNKQQ